MASLIDIFNNESPNLLIDPLEYERFNLTQQKRDVKMLFVSFFYG